MNWIKPIVSTFGGWWSTMSGAISIPFAFLALFLPSTTARPLFVALAYISLLVTAIMMAVNHQKEKKKHSDEIQRLSKELDDTRVSINGQMVVQNTDKLRVLLQVKAVNFGRRPVRVTKLAAMLTKTSSIRPMNLSPEQAVAFANLNEKTCASHELVFFEKPGQQAIELAADGGAHDWAQEIGRNFEFHSEEHTGEKLGRGYVTLTSGKKFEFVFPLLSEWPRGC